jgi:hypothetical protein
MFLLFSLPHFLSVDTSIFPPSPHYVAAHLQILLFAFKNTIVYGRIFLSTEALGCNWVGDGDAGTSLWWRFY